MTVPVKLKASHHRKVRVPVPMPTEIERAIQAFCLFDLAEPTEIERAIQAFCESPTP
jgi:hypothetical protein